MTHLPEAYRTVDDYLLAVSRGNIPGQSSFRKFGRNGEIDTTSDPEDIWGGGGLYTGFPTGGAETMEIFSSQAADTSAGTGARTVEISNLRDSTGAAADNVILSLNGTTPVSLGIDTFTRGSRVKVKTAGSGGGNAGTLTLRHTTTTANIFAVMPIGANQTQIAAYSVPLGHTLHTNRMFIRLARLSGAAGSAEVSLRVREFGGVFQTHVTPEVTDGGPYSERDVWHRFPALTDFKFTCDEVSDNDTVITANISGVLIKD